MVKHIDELQSLILTTLKFFKYLDYNSLIFVLCMVVMGIFAYVCTLRLIYNLYKTNELDFTLLCLMGASIMGMVLSARGI